MNSPEVKTKAPSGGGGGGGGEEDDSEELLNSCSGWPENELRKKIVREIDRERETNPSYFYSQSVISRNNNNYRKCFGSSASVGCGLEVQEQKQKYSESVQFPSDSNSNFSCATSKKLKITKKFDSANLSKTVVQQNGETDDHHEDDDDFSLETTKTKRKRHYDRISGENNFNGDVTITTTGGSSSRECSTKRFKLWSLIMSMPHHHPSLLKKKNNNSISSSKFSPVAIIFSSRLLLSSTTFSIIKFLSVIFILSSWILRPVSANGAPQFVLSEGQSEIVLRLKEGPETPVGSRIYRLKGYDPDGDPLTFGVRGQIANELLRIENLGSDEANVFLKKELDRETASFFNLVVTVTDNVADGSFVTQSLLLLVEDVNDNSPVFAPYQATIKVPENGDVPTILTTLEATDRDDGIYGQVVYKLQTEAGDESLFSISTVNGKGVLKLLKPLDYEKKFLYQLRVLAVDRSSDPSQVNTATAAVVVQVVDVEDRSPDWVTVPPVTRIEENVPVGTYVLQVRAVDGDRGVNNEISYSLLNENDSFGVDVQSGIVFTKSTLDRENNNGGSYILQIVATEKSKIRPPPSTKTECTVIINDVNDETPRFRSRSYLGVIFYILYNLYNISIYIF